MSDGAVPADVPLNRRHIVAWASWDWGSAAFNAVVTTFVFTVWLTSGAFVEPGADAGATKALHSQWLGWGIAAAGVLVALTAPALGAIADSAGRRKPLLAVTSALVGLSILALVTVAPEPGRMDRAVVLGITLLAVGTIAFEIGTVAYNALLLQITTPRTLGRVSGIGWGAGYVGGIVLLLVLYVGLVSDGAVLGVTTDHGWNFRVAMLVAGIWFLAFALPVLLVVPDAPPAAARTRIGLIGAYREIAANLSGMWRRERPTLQFLIASAVFRDGLTGVFTFGGVLAAGTFGFTSGQVIVFAIAANIVAGVATIASGWLDDRFGPRRVIAVSLVVLVAAGSMVFVLHAGGPAVFWVFGLILASCVGPAQSASRALLARLTPPERETEMFGLYATTGRAATFLAPAAFSTAIRIGGPQYWGILGVVVVLLAGLLLFLPVRFPRGRGIEGVHDAPPASVVAA